MKEGKLKDFIDKYATGMEALRIDMWSVFKPHKYKRFEREFKRGKTFSAAYDEAMNGS